MCMWVNVLLGMHIRAGAQACAHGCVLVHVHVGVHAV